jgi:hypothetical protein
MGGVSCQDPTGLAQIPAVYPPKGRVITLSSSEDFLYLSENCRGDSLSADLEPRICAKPLL